MIHARPVSIYVLAGFVLSGALKNSEQVPESSYASLYYKSVIGADRGADFDFLIGHRGKAIPKDSH